MLLIPYCDAIDGFSSTFTFPTTTLPSYSQQVGPRLVQPSGKVHTTQPRSQSVQALWILILPTQSLNQILLLYIFPFPTFHINNISEKNIALIYPEGFPNSELKIITFDGNFFIWLQKSSNSRIIEFVGLI